MPLAASPTPVGAYRHFFESLAEPAIIGRVVRDDSGAVVDWLVVDMNPAALQRVPHRDAIGQLASMKMPRDIFLSMLPVLDEVMRTRAPRDIERHFNGTDYLCHISALDGDTWSEVCHDVTEERLAPTALRERREHSFAFEWTPADDRVRRSANCAGLFGLKGQAALEDTASDFFQRVHPGDRERLRSVIRSLRPGANRYEITYRIVKPDGGVTVVEECAQAAFDDAGVMTRLVGITTDVTARARAEQVLRDSQARLTIAKEAAALGIHDFDVLSGRVEWDRRVRELFGVDDDAPVTYETFIEGIHPDDREAADASVRQALDPQGDGRCYVEYRCRNRRDGAERWIAATGKAFFEEGRAVRLVGTVQDITERKRIEEALRASEAKFRTVIEHSLDGINMLDLATGRYVFMSPAQVAMTGFCMEELEGMTAEAAYGRVHPDDRHVSVAQQQAIVAGLDIAKTVEYRWRVKSGEYRWFSDSRKLVRDADGRPVALVGVSRDITEQKRVQVALTEADRRKDEFLATLSHELRNPLAPIRFAIPLLRQETLSEAGTRAVGAIERQVSHLTRLVDDLLDVSRITRGKVVLQRERLDLGAALAAAAEAASPAVLQGHHRFTTSVRDAPIWVYADPARVSQVVTNLLDNAAKFTPPGGEIRLEAGLEDGQAVVRVSDTGPGIPEEALSSVFDMFVQVNTRDARMNGLGIGLALSRQLVELHGGTIEARRSAQGSGTEFIVRFPLAAGIGEEEPACSLGAGMPERRLKVLIIDDNVDLVEMLVAVVESNGHHPSSALDGKSGIAAALAQQPDVVLLDLGLPDLDGCDVARELRRAPQLQGVHLVALTGWGQQADREKTREAGFDRHLTKPADPQTLASLLAEVAVAQAGRAQTPHEPSR